MSSGTLLTRNDGLTTGDALHSVCFLFGHDPASPTTLGGCLAVLQRNVPPWEYGKPLKQRLLPARLRRLTHEDSAQSTNWRYRHRSGLYPSGSGDGSRCQKPVLCSRRWMAGTRSVRWMRWEKPVSPRSQRKVTIDPLSILCPSRGGSTSLEKHLDPVCAVFSARCNFADQ